MSSYMICCQFMDGDGIHLASLFADTYKQAQDVITNLVCGLGAQVQLYQWDSEN